MDGTPLADNQKADKNAKADDTTNPKTEAKQSTVSSDLSSASLDGQLSGDIKGAAMGLDKQPPAATSDAKALAQIHDGDPWALEENEFVAHPR